MKKHTQKSQETTKQAIANDVTQMPSKEEASSPFVDNRPEAVTQRKLKDIANTSPQVQQAARFQAIANGKSNESQSSTHSSKSSNEAPIQRMVDGSRNPDDFRVQHFYQALNDEQKSLFDAYVRRDGGMAGTMQNKEYTTEEVLNEIGAQKALKVIKRLKDHEEQVSKQTSEYDVNPELTGKLHVAPHNFKIAGHGSQTITNEEYSTYAQSKGLPPEDSRHYMEGLTLNEEQFEDRMKVERVEESVPDHRAHSGGYFASKYTDQERATFDMSTYGGPDTTGKGNEQVFHPGKHNPYQSDFNLKHRLTEGVPADSATGAYTNISSKFISDKISMEALNTAKAKATQELKTNPATYQTSSGDFYKSYTVKCDLGKETGEGFEAPDKSTGTKQNITDLYGNSSEEESARKAAKSKLSDDSYLSDAEAAEAVSTAKSWIALGKTRIEIKAEIIRVLGISGKVISAPDANKIAKAIEPSVKVYNDPNIRTIPSGAATGTQTGLTLKSIKADGSGAVWELGAGQHYPAQTSSGDFSMEKYGNDTIAGS